MSSLTETPFMTDEPSSDCRSCLPALFGVGAHHHRNKNNNVNLFADHQSSRIKLKETEDKLASDMQNLSVQERSIALDDVHCVGQDLVETPEMIAKSLEEFDELVQLINNPVYKMAERQNRSYVENPDFRLLFLRSNLHNVSKSVQDMMNFLRYKALFFGNEKVARDITFDDLNKEDKKWLLAGAYHIQDGRDQKGRVILYLFNTFLGKCKIETHSRITYYIIFNILAPMPDVQTKGLVTCYYDISSPGDFTIPGPSFMMTSIDFLNSIPVRFSAMHHCLKTDMNNLALNSLCLEVAFKLFPHYNRARARIHYGTHMELQYTLQGHGVPMDTCPVDSDGNFRRDIFLVWFHKRRAIEGFHYNENEFDEATQDPITPQYYMDDEDSCDDGDNEENIGPNATTDPVTPLRHDVLLGRGRANQNHLGNVCFREFLKQYAQEYELAPRKGRRQVVSKIRVDLKSRGIRFLQERNDEWIECNVAEAEKTIAQAFRNRRKGR